MAVINANHASHGGGVHAVTWPALANGDTGEACDVVALPDKTVQVVGTFGTGGSITMQGSNDGTNWATLTDPLGNDITFTATGLKTLLENPLYIRPIVTAGDGTTSLTAILAALDVSN